MENISKEPEETCIYKRFYLDYTYGLDRIHKARDREGQEVTVFF